MVRVFVSGATGSNGVPIVHHLIVEGGFTVVCLVRDINKAEVKDFLSWGCEVVQGIYFMQTYT